MKSLDRGGFRRGISSCRRATTFQARPSAALRRVAERLAESSAGRLLFSPAERGGGQIGSAPSDRDRAEADERRAGPSVAPHAVDFPFPLLAELRAGTTIFVVQTLIEPGDRILACGFAPPGSEPVAPVCPARCPHDRGREPDAPPPLRRNSHGMSRDPSKKAAAESRCDVVQNVPCVPARRLPHRGTGDLARIGYIGEGAPAPKSRAFEPSTAACRR